MPRIAPLAQPAGEAKTLLDAVQSKLGATPNMFRTFAHSPAALNGLLGLFAAADAGSLGKPLVEKIALVVAEANGCQYCLSAHSYLGKHVAKLDDKALDQARTGRSQDAREQAALRFAGAVLEERGHVSDAELKAVRDAGFSDAAILDIVTAVALNVLTNYANVVTQVEVDFPVVKLRSAA
ncbi:MAG TPA: peroxidase-related enzyme [Gammaproteobacteria bacterium]|jgi:uncharacterized peroxidase-related enzyme|nr:peroxidase-related enzyme [Gammaproteobacteria bacterium]